MLHAWTQFRCTIDKGIPCSEFARPIYLQMCLQLYLAGELLCSASPCRHPRGGFAGGRKKGKGEEVKGTPPAGL